MTLPSRRDIIFWGLLLLIVLALFLWQWQPAHGSNWEYDEGINAMKARLFLDGYSLYSEIWSDQPPLFTLLLAAAFAIFGQSVFVGRALVLAFSGLSIVAAGWIGRHLAGRMAGLTMALLLALFPHFQQLSRLIMIGLPAISVALVAIMAGLAYQATGRKGWLVLSGIAFGLSLLIKPLTAPLYLPLSALALLDADRRRATAPERLRSWVMFSTMVAVLPLVALALFDTTAFLRQVIGIFLRARDAHSLSLINNLARIGDYLFRDKWGLCYVGLMCLAVAGLLGLAAQRQRGHLIPLGLWLGSAFLAVVFHSPLRRHHVFLIMPAIVVSAGLGVQQAVKGAMTIREANRFARASVIVALGGILLVALNLPNILRVDLAMVTVSPSDQQELLARNEAVRFLESRTPPGSVIITDDPMLAFKSERSVPPMLAVPSARRMEADEFPSTTLIDLTKEVQPSAILFWEQRLSRVTGYSNWVSANYCIIRAYPDGRWIHVPCDPAEIAFPQPASSRKGIAFLGSSVTRLGLDPGDSLELCLYLRAEGTIDQDYTLFVHLLDEQGNCWGQVDQQPFQGHYPMSQWRRGQTLIQEIALPVRSDAPPGEKILAVGFYDAQVRRLPLYDGQGHPFPDGQLILSPRPVVRWEARFDAPTLLHPQVATLGNYVQLLGYDLDDGPLHPGDVIPLTLYWQCLSEMRTSYTVFTHLLNEQGELVAQRDQVPGQGAFPTTGWRPGEVIADQYRIPLPEDSPSGIYHLAIGMYDLATGVRLPVSGEGGSAAQDRVLLIESVQVAPRHRQEQKR